MATYDPFVYYCNQQTYDFLLTCGPHVKKWAEEGVADGTIVIYEVYVESFKEKIARYWRWLNQSLWT